MNNGYFITIEGIEGAGKSTVIKHIRKIIKQNSIEALFTREPGGTDNAEKIRELLLSENLVDPDPTTELMLMFASRNEHYKSLILPALENDKFVISDRFYDATYAYQGGGRNIDLTLIDNLKELVLGDFAPDLTILLDIPISVSLERIAKRKHLDRIESENIDFFERVRDTYLSIAKSDSRFVVIDASQSLSGVKRQVTDVLKNIPIMSSYNV